MRSRFSLAVATLFAATLGAAAAPAPVVKSSGGPPVVFQLATGQKLLDGVKKIVGIVAGDGFAGLIDGQIKGKLGEKGFAGLDMSKPICGYLYLPNKALKGPDDFREIYGFVAIPVTGEDEFKDFIARLSPPNDPLQFKPVEGNKGLYSLETNHRDDDQIPVRARFHDGHLYVGINAKDELLDTKNLLPVKSLVKADDPGLMLVRIFTDRYPEELMKQQAAPFEQFNDQLQGIGWGELAASILKSYSALSQRMASQMKDTDESGFRIAFDEKAADIAIESYAIPKKGSAYAKELAAMKPSENRFASLFTDNLAAGGMFQMPIAAPEMRDIFNKLIEAGQKAKDENAPEFARPMIDELLKGLGRTIKGESIDFAFGVNGPNKDGKFTAFGAVNFDDATGLEKAIKAASKHEDAPGNFKNEIKFDVAQLEGLNVHRIETSGENDSVKSIFGSNEFHFVLGSKGIYFAMGPEWKDSIKAALAPKSGPTKVIDLVANPKRLGDLIKAGSEQAGGIAATMLGTEDRRFSLFSVSYEGGATLKARVTISLKGLPKMMMFWATPFRGG